MTTLAIIGGSGLTELPELEISEEINQTTPWGNPSAPIVRGSYAGQTILFLPRHGNPHTLLPHRINYRANIQALRDLGVDEIIAVNAVGGITTDMCPGRIAIPDQLIDYTHGRADTFHGDDPATVTHIDFTAPYAESIRQKLIRAAADNQQEITAAGTLGVTQGPRLETAAEINRLERDGCDLVGMTGMPEAGLARELNIDYACCALVVNWAAGKTDDIITMEIIDRHLTEGLARIRPLLSTVLANQ